jgi:hypothetical protein
MSHVIKLLSEIVIMYHFTCHFMLGYGSYLSLCVSFQCHALLLFYTKK